METNKYHGKMLKQMIIIRKDLNMRKGKMVSQGAHASMKAVLENLNDNRVKEWLNSAFTKITVSVNNEDELLKLYNEAKENNIICAEIIDNGKTEFGGNKTRTCIAIGPDIDEVINPLTKNLKLL